ncbi:MAG TPA: penicillin-binding protein activator [Myxococcota bacterium]|nr:penicillin-binding protein activator [Myxococcota bacterium]HRY93197.1 penicillin-binding protein activator [Myxococcota bacterium]
MPSLRPIAAALCALCLLPACPPPTVVVGGREVSPEEGERLTYQDAEASLKAGRTDEARARLEAYLENFPEGPRAADALFALGGLHEAAGRAEPALEAFRRVVAEFPSSSHYLPSTVRMGLLLVQLGRVQEALPTLQSVFDRLPDEKRKAEVAGMLAESYERAGAPLEALRWYAALHRLVADPAQREVLGQKVTDLLDGALSFKAVREAVEILRGGTDFPADMATLKLAKIFYHVGELGEARRVLEDFVARWPGHARSGEAGALLKRILDRDKVNPVAIGVLLPLTGEYREYGQKALESIQLGAGVFEEPRADRPALVLVIRDTAGKPEQAAAMVEELVFQEHVACVLGPMFTGEAYAAAIKAQELEVPLLALSARPGLTGVGSYVFRNFLTLEAQARALVDYATARLGVKRFALLYPNDKYGVGFVNAFWDEIRKHDKAEVRAAERYEPDTKTYTEPVKKMVGRFWVQARWEYIQAVAKIRRDTDSNLARQRAVEKLRKTLKPEIDFQAIFVPDYFENVALLAPALAFEDIVLKTSSQYQLDRTKDSLGYKPDMVYLLGGNGWNNPKLVEWAERYVQGAIFTDGFFLDSSRPVTRMFVAKFKTQFDRNPDAVDAHAHDSALMVRQVVEGARPQTRPAFRKALLELAGFEGATGRTRFREDGEAEKELFLLTVKRDEIKEIELGPEPAPAGS